MKDYKFKEEFEKKLGSDKEAFIANLKKQQRYTEENIRKLNNSANFEEFVFDGFIFEIDEEKHWKDVAKR